MNLNLRNSCTYRLFNTSYTNICTVLLKIVISQNNKISLAVDLQLVWVVEGCGLQGEVLLVLEVVCELSRR